MPRGVRTTRGFTLLELLVVVAILGLVVAAAATRLSRGYRNAQLRRAAQVVQEVDRLARLTAQRQASPLELSIHVSESRFELRRQGKAVAPPRYLPSPIRLGEALTRREQRGSGEVVVRYDQHGRSGTYAVQIATPSGAVRWLAFAGMTGQVEELLSGNKIKDLFRALQQSRLNAD